FHVVRFQQMAKEAMKKIREHGHIPILVGGTGFYIQAIVKDIDFTENEASPYREELTRLAEEKGADFLYEKLQKVDPKSAQIIHAHNVKRIIRALEFYQMTGKKISEHNKKQREKSSPYQFAYFVLQDERTKLYKRIEARIDEMLQDGLIEEVTALKEMGLKRGMVSMQGLGYKEILAYLDGECTLEEAVEILKRDTRHFAKRQITWFKREEEVIWLDKGKFAYQEEQILEAMLQILKEKEII
ncbi:MAG: tRNA (adenosine(37)-N6)-dimethylallyltransferase MiaA, partial [Lachnospiraceae bacterium]|nr:tRNA (adenosine(37)-N6)-dimethylallyltransferase MiaA [Lachnospiraceae bacterium]